MCLDFAGSSHRRVPHAALERCLPRVIRTAMEHTISLQVSERAFEIKLVEGRNRQIRKMCAALGYDVTDLHRVDVSSIGLQGLRPGKWLPLSASELEVVERVLHKAGSCP